MPYLELCSELRLDCSSNRSSSIPPETQVEANRMCISPWRVLRVCQIPDYLVLKDLVLELGFYLSAYVETRTIDHHHVATFNVAFFFKLDYCYTHYYA
jgi:hypothetical protein